MLNVKESDWKLFRKKLPGWQERYMDCLNREYIQILSGDEAITEEDLDGFSEELVEVVRYCAAAERED